MSPAPISGGSSEGPPTGGLDRTVTADGRAGAAAEPAVPALSDLALPPRFSPIAILGAGATGVVVHARDSALGRDVAVKLIAKERLGDARTRNRFLREAKAAARLRHPHIVTVHDVDPQGKFIVMQLVRGDTLKQRIARDGRLPPDAVRTLGAALLDALAAAHDAGIVHRDVKPANILGAGDSIALADFGVAGVVDSDLTATGERVGTPAYMAPEQLRGGGAGPRADLYAVGATLFEAATGQRLHGEDGAAADVESRVMTATGDQALAASIARAVNQRPEDRFTDARAFAAALGRAPLAARGRSRRLLWMMAAGGIAAALAAGGALWAMHGSADAPERRAARPVGSSPRLAILPFDDQTGDRRLDFASSGLAHILESELGRADGLAVIGTYRIRDHLAGAASSDAAAWTAAARELGADHVARGRLRAAGQGKVEVEIRLDTIDGRPVERFSRLCTIEEVPGAVRSAAPALALAILGHQPALPAGRAGVAFAVERELQLGIAALERQEFDAAVAHLESAASAPGAPAEAHYKLAIAYWWTSRPSPRTLEEIDRALAGPLDADSAELCRALKQLIGLDFPDVIARFRSLAARLPHDRDVQYGLFEALFHGGRPDEALAAYEELRRQVPGFALGAGHALACALSRSDLEAARRFLGNTDAVDGAAFPDRPLWQARLRAAQGDIPGAVALLERAREAAPDAAAASRLGWELVALHAVAGERIAARELTGELARHDMRRAALPLLGLALAAGTSAGAEGSSYLWQVASSAAGVPESPEVGTREAWVDLAAFIAVAPRRSQAELVASQLGWEGAGHFLEADLARAFLADALDDRRQLERLAASGFAEVAAVVRAATAERAHDLAAAREAWRQALAISCGRFRLAETLRLAAVLDAAGDRAGAARACAEVRRPPLFHWSWGGAVARCAALTGGRTPP